MYSPLFSHFSCCHCFCPCHCFCHFIVILLSVVDYQSTFSKYKCCSVFLSASIPASVCFLARLCWLLPDNAVFCCILWLDSLPLHHCFSIAAYCHTCLISTPHSRLFRRPPRTPVRPGTSQASNFACISAVLPS